MIDMCRFFIYPFLDCDVYQNACTIGVTNHGWNPIYIARELSFQDCVTAVDQATDMIRRCFRYICINYDREPSSFLFKTAYTILTKGGKWIYTKADTGHPNREGWRYWSVVIGGAYHWWHDKPAYIHIIRFLYGNTQQKPIRRLRTNIRIHLITLNLHKTKHSLIDLQFLKILFFLVAYCYC